MLYNSNKSPPSAVPSSAITLFCKLGMIHYFIIVKKPLNGEKITTPTFKTDLSGIAGTEAGALNDCFLYV